jgi:hypothetical protein
VKDVLEDLGIGGRIIDTIELTEVRREYMTLIDLV